LRRGFTLIELLVVMSIITIVMGVVIPKGAKMLDGFEQSLKIVQAKQSLSKARSLSFIQAKEKHIDILGNSYYISSKGVITKNEKSNADN